MVIKGSFYSAETPDEIQYGRQRLVVIDQAGYIKAIIAPQEADYQTIWQQAARSDSLLELRADQILLPGFIDLHIHAPQWPNAGLALDQPLAEWLNIYTFPLEAKYQDAHWARRVYRDLVKELLAQGTTTALYFGGVDNTGNFELAKACCHYQQRGFIGKVAMDNPEQTPANYRDANSAAALQGTEDFIKFIADLNHQAAVQLTPVITPRFVPSCTAETLAGLGKLAQQYALPIQSHCSESDWEDNYALEHFQKRDAAVLDQFGLLTQRSVMAHGTLLNDTDYQLFIQRQAALAHCPISNVYFGNAVLPVTHILHQPIKVGLGTDISGGYSPSIYQNIRQALISSRQLHDGVDGRLAPSQRGTGSSVLTAASGFYLATVGGARSLQLPTGQIKVGQLADLQIVHQNWTSTAQLTPQQIFEKLIYQTDKNNIDQVLVQGIIVKG